MVESGGRVLLAACFRFTVAIAACIALSVGAGAQTTPTQQPSQTPKTAPQTAQVLPSYEGQRVSSVEIAGQPNVRTADLLPYLAQKKGEPFSQTKVDQSIAALKRTGKFHDVQLEVWPDPDGVRVLFVLQPAIYFGIFDFPGASNSLSYSRLLQVTNYPPRGEYNELDVERAQQGLETFLKRAGYFLSQVKPQVQNDEKHGLANVMFNINMNQRAKFGNVNITGAPADQSEHLKKSLQSFRARLRGAAIRPNKTYKFKTLQNATQYLQNLLAKQDYLDAQVQLQGAKYDRESNLAEVTFNVQPGPLIHVEVEGAHLWSWTRKKLLPVYQQLGVNPEVIQEGQQNLVSHFQSKGYFDVKVDSKELKHSPAETILYQITKGPRHRVAEVSIVGNQHMPEKELLSHATLKKAHFFTHGKFSDRDLRKSITNLKGVYQAAGFSDVKITPQVTTRGENIVVTLRVEEGEQDIVQALRLEGNSLPESEVAPKGLNLAPGKPYSQKLADNDRNQIIARYLELGYLTANFRQTAEKVPNQPHRLEVVYKINEGPQVHTASIVTLGRRYTQPRLIQMDTASIQPGRPLKENDLLSSETLLYTRNIFDWAQVDPRRQITTQTEEDVVVKVHESNKNSITYGFGFEVINRGGNIPGGTIAVPGLPPIGLPSNFVTSEQTFWGPRGSFEYTRSNLRGKAESITLSALAARLEQRGAVTYTDPLFRWSKWSSNVSLSGEHNSENPIFISNQGRVGFQFQRTLDPAKTQNVFLRYSFSETGVSQLLIPELIPPEDQHVRLSRLSSTFTRDTRDMPLDAHKGIYESFEFAFNPIWMGSSDSFTKLLAQTAYYKKIPADIIWANSLRIGLEQAIGSSHVPISEKFFSGGGSTLRGFPLNGAGPQQSVQACGNPSDLSTCSLIRVPVGGIQLLIINSEFRIPVPVKKGLGVAAFYDGGNVFQHIGFHGSYSNTIGLGLRYATPVGPVRIDVGHNLNPIPGINSTQLFITLGQAF
ncbi:MAG: outer membrane protein [Acidobacteriaceae bacterium]|nr:outer membrane protein [Acidobacteriaceae bacterium]